jgi:two-component system LytT family sensor kinase
MKEPDINSIVLIVLFSSLTLICGLYLLAKFNSLFRKQLSNELVRKNIVVWMVAVCLILALTPTRQEFYIGLMSHTLFHYFLVQLLAVTVEVLFVFNSTWFVIRRLRTKRVSFMQRMTIVLFVIILSCMLISVPVNYYANGNSFKNLALGLVYTFYTGCMTGLVYVTMSYVDLDRNKKLNEKELEVARLQQLKTKAELDVLHSKINPHFLYNALNSIADLSITDGKKARKMTIALADLFRYSINYSDHNYSTVREEIEMAEAYMQIEKIRFEDNLNYSVHVAEDVNHYLVPRFILQPIVENAVKHGLKATGKMTEVHIEVKNDNGVLEINVADNGPAFPDELIPGYGIKSIYDKLDLLFPGTYEVYFTNQPGKRVSIHINKLMKSEPVV